MQKNINFNDLFPPTNVADEPKESCQSQKFLCEMDPEIGTLQCSAATNTENVTQCNTDCNDVVLDALDVLETMGTKEEARNALSLEDLNMLRTSANVQDVSDEAMVHAFYPDREANLQVVCDEQMGNSSGFDGFSGGGANEDNDNDNGSRRFLQMCGSKCDGDQLHEFFGDKPKGCFAATSVMLASVLDMQFSYLQLDSPVSLGTKVAWSMLMQAKNTPMFVNLFDAYETSNLTLAGEQVDPACLGFSMVGYILRHFGVNAMWCAMSTSMTTSEIIRSGCSALLSMAAISTTNGAIMSQSSTLMAGPMADFYDSYLEWEEKCFGMDLVNKVGEEDDNGEDDNEEENIEEEEEEQDPCPAVQPSCDDNDLCTLDTVTCDESTGFQWVCENAKSECADPNESCDPADGVCKGRCPSEVPDCDDGNLCTQDSPKCDASTGFEWQCDQVPMVCGGPNESCDPFDGACKENEQLVPCVAVIDEDDDFKQGFLSRDQEKLWRDFRAEYPTRPFCLLVPNKKGEMRVPRDFLTDSRTTVRYQVTRDNGAVAKADDWAELCGLQNYTKANVKFVGLFIDDSGSLKEKQVAASRDMFYKNMQSRGIEVRKVVNTHENWMKPFMTTLVP